MVTLYPAENLFSLRHISQACLQQQLVIKGKHNPLGGAQVG
jgi:hypothetical protein